MVARPRPILPMDWCWQGQSGFLDKLVECIAKNIKLLFIKYLWQLFELSPSVAPHYRQEQILEPIA
jgi:hypothetical protein